MARPPLRLDQETQFVRSGLSEYFRYLEVVSEKGAFSYSRVLRRHRICPANFLMVGSSLLLDVWPVLAIGGQLVYIPSPATGNKDPQPQGAYVQLERIGQLPDWLESRLLAA